MFDFSEPINSDLIIKGYTFSVVYEKLFTLQL